MSDFVWLIPDALVTPSATVLAPGKVDHITDGLARLCSQFADKQNIIDLLAVFLQRYQDVENVFWDLLTLRDAYTATGAALDGVGKLVGQPRNGMLDEDYRRFIFARIATNNSNGTIEDLIKVTRLVLNNTLLRVVVRNDGVAAVRVQLEGDDVDTALADVVILFLRLAASAGVRVILESRMDPLDTEMFTTPPTAFVSIASLAGATSVAVGTDHNFTLFPATGTVEIDAGLAVAETVNYTAVGFSAGSWRVTFAAPLANAHAIGAPICCTALGKGFGNSGDVGQPTLIAYQNVGTIGGRLADARE